MEQVLQQETTYDLLNFAKDPSILKIIGNETFLFSDTITKINRFGFQQYRNLVITNNAIYNLKAKNLQRRLDISKLKGITTSKNSNEFVLHGNEEEYDYYYISRSKKKIIYLLEKSFEGLTGGELLFANLDSSHIKNVVTTKREKKKNFKFSRMDDSELSDIKEYIKNECTFLRTDNSLAQKIKIDDEDNIMNLNRQDSLFDTERKLKSIWEADDFDNDIVEYEEVKETLNVTRAIRNDTMINDEFVQLPKRTFEDFTFLNVIGRGKFTTTYIAQYNKDTTHENSVFAIKVGEKHILINNDFVDNLANEKRILTTLKVIEGQHFIGLLVSCFQTQEKVFLVTNFFKGGDLYTLLSRKKTLDEKTVIIYAAQIVIALSHLHENNIIYRNLKLENVCLTEKGFIRLIDFSKSKILNFDEDLGTSFYGTAEYFAPEIIEGVGQTKSIDWWMLGVFVYELLYGYAPFRGNSVERVFDLITFTDVKFPPDKQISDDMKDFITRLLQKNCELRLGYKEDGEEIKRHPVFKDIRFEDIEKENIEPPIKPEIFGKNDCGNFDEELIEEEIEMNQYIDGYNLERIKHGNSQGIFSSFV